MKELLQTSMRRPAERGLRRPMMNMQSLLPKLRQDQAMRPDRRRRLRMKSLPQISGINR